MSDPEHIGVIVERVVREMGRLKMFCDDHDKVVAGKNAEIARCHDLMFTAANCDPEIDRRGPHCYCVRRQRTDDDGFRCPFWAVDHCDVDGWEPPE